MSATQKKSAVVYGSSLPTCNNCSRPETEERKLKRCPPCNGIFYCSLECQKKAWPWHKPVCKSTYSGSEALRAAADAKVANFGYASAREFNNDVADFMHAHTWAFIVTAYMHWQDLAETTPQERHSELPRVFRFSMCHVSDEACSAGSPSTQVPTNTTKNPATRFKLVSYTITRLEDYIHTRPDSWASTARMRQQCETYFAHDPAYNGMLVIEYCVGGVIDQTHSIEFLPLWRNRRREQGQPQASSEVKSILLRDLVAFCINSINGGFPLRCVEGTNQRVAYPGRCVREDGRWMWKPLFNLSGKTRVANYL
ncbi:hypothetical protein C8Q80DRAFT_284070 [Daedaleopsis nitida]|nr:hypothetical protein C8Q80DRAFT_284070 [Daedaleopsis nitida]